MTYDDELWEANRDLAEACLRHPFVRGLGDGTLPEERYVLFMGQRSFVLDACARAFAVTVARTRQRRRMRELFNLLEGAFDEQRLHEEVAAEHGVDLQNVEPLPATRASSDFLVATAFGGTVGEALAATAPYLRLHGFLGRELASADYDERYSEWILTYASEGFADFVATIDGLVDRLGNRGEREAERYRTALEMEIAFLEAAWWGPLEAATS